ncbi:MAG: methyltransferase, partial [Daejeonella sp.]
MKVNTDAVLLAAIADHSNPISILDIGTGTGVIAMMLAQRFTDAIIDAVEIDQLAFQTSKENFENSIFKNRLNAHSNSFQDFLQKEDSKYDLIVSNPPFFLKSLPSENKSKMVARHADEHFYTDLAKIIPQRLNPAGHLTMILPVETAKYAIKLFSEQDLW